MQIVKYPNKILRKKLAIFSDFKNPELSKFVKEMSLTMQKQDGVGLAGNQVNSEIRVIVANTKNGAIAFFNPRIIKKSILKSTGEEGCLSFPKIYGNVSRNKKIILEYEDTNGNTKKIQANGLLSVVLQHETDHVNGILFIDKIKKITSGQDQLEHLKRTAKTNEK